MNPQPQWWQALLDELWQILHEFFHPLITALQWLRRRK